jgi:hypothetical protein
MPIANSSSRQRPPRKSLGTAAGRGFKPRPRLQTFCSEPSHLIRQSRVVADVDAQMKKGFDIHDFNRRMELAQAGLRRNQNVSIHNRLKIQGFLDYLETQEVGLPRRIRYLLNLGKFAAMLQTDFEKATRTLKHFS